MRRTSPPCECVRLGAEGGHDGEWRRSRRWACIASGAPFERTPENVNLRHEDRLERFSGMVFEDEIVNVRDRHFSGFFRIQILESIPKEKRKRSTAVAQGYVSTKGRQLGWVEPNRLGIRWYQTCLT